MKGGYVHDLDKGFVLIVFTCKCFLHGKVLDETTICDFLINVPQFGRLNLRYLWGLASSTILLKVSGSDFRRRQTMQYVTEAMIPMVAMLLTTAAAIISTDRGPGRLNSRKQSSSPTRFLAVNLYFPASLSLASWMVSVPAV